MIDEKNLQRLLITAEEKSWRSKWILPPYGAWLDWDDDAWALENTRFFLKFFYAFDVETRNKYLKKRAQNDASDAPDTNFDDNFLRQFLAESRQRGEKYFARKTAAIYFEDEQLLEWYRNIFLNEENEWVYTPARDDVYLAKLLADVALRVKTPSVVREVFLIWVAKYCGTLTFRKANRKYDYQPEIFFSDAYDRLVGRNGQRISFWLTARPTETLGEWCELETLRELDRALKQRQRASLALRLVDDLRKLGDKKATNDVKPTPSVDIQALFDALVAESPTDAFLLTAWLHSAATFSELTTFWSIGEAKPIEGKTLNKRFERASERFREILARKLKIEIPKERWKNIVTVFLQDDAQSDKAKDESEMSARFKDTKSHRKPVRFIEPPTKEERALLLNVLEAKRINETGRYIRLAQRKMQGGGFVSSNVVFSGGGRWGDVPTKEREKEEEELKASSNFQRPPRICGAPIDETYDAESARRFWRNRCSKNTSIMFYFESATEGPRSEKYWRAEARIPLLAAPDDEMCFIFSGYDSLRAAPYSVTLGEKTSPVIHGVAIFTVADFRASVKKGELPSVTVLLRHIVKTGRWHVRVDSPVRLLLRQPVVPDRER